MPHLALEAHWEVEAMTTNSTSHMEFRTWPFLPLGLPPSVPSSLCGQGNAQFSTHLSERWARFSSSSVLSPCPPQTPALRAGQSPGEVASLGLSSCASAFLSFLGPQLSSAHSYHSGSCPCTQPSVPPTWQWFQTPHLQPLTFPLGLRSGSWTKVASEAEASQTEHIQMESPSSPIPAPPANPHLPLHPSHHHGLTQTQLGLSLAHQSAHTLSHLKLTPSHSQTHLPTTSPFCCHSARSPLLWNLLHLALASHFSSLRLDCTSPMHLSCTRMSRGTLTTRIPARLLLPPSHYQLLPDLSPLPPCPTVMPQPIMMITSQSAYLLHSSAELTWQNPSLG